MSITLDAQRARAGQSLLDMSNQAQQAIAQVSNIKGNLKNLADSMAGQPDVYTTSDIDEVNAIITEINTKIASL